MRRFSRRTALVSAAASGLGEAIAARLASEGAHVVVLDASAAAIAEARSRVSAHAGQIEFREVDLTDQDEVSATLAELHAAGVGFDILVNNAGGSLHTPRAFLDETDADWHRVFDLNITTTVRLTRAVIPGMVARGYGRIVNLGSKAGRFGSLFTGANYVAAKGAVQSMTLQLAQEFGPAGLTCNAVCPGAIETPRVERLLAERMSHDDRARMLEAIPVRRRGLVEDVAAAVAFLVSEEAGFITGQLLDVNGGQGMCS